jgi:hypothetical protein
MRFRCASRPGEAVTSWSRGSVFNITRASILLTVFLGESFSQSIAIVNLALRIRKVAVWSIDWFTLWWRYSWRASRADLLLIELRQHSSDRSGLSFLWPLLSCLPWKSFLLRWDLILLLRSLEAAICRTEVSIFIIAIIYLLLLTFSWAHTVFPLLIHADRIMLRVFSRRSFRKRRSLLKGLCYFGLCTWIWIIVFLILKSWSWVTRCVID